MAQVNLNIDELKGFLQHIISTNRKLQSENKKPVAVEVVGDSGIGKTSTILQVAEESGLDLVKLNLAQIIKCIVRFPLQATH
jgi:predicted GTPase